MTFRKSGRAAVGEGIGISQRPRCFEFLEKGTGPPDSPSARASSPSFPATEGALVGVPSAIARARARERERETRNSSRGSGWPSPRFYGPAAPALRSALVYRGSLPPSIAPPVFGGVLDFCPFTKERRRNQ